MNLKVAWLTTIGLSSCALVAAMPLSEAATQLWKPEVAHAAKVTVRLVKSKSFNPIDLNRRSRMLPAAVPVVSQDGRIDEQDWQNSLNRRFDQPKPQS